MILNRGRGVAVLAVFTCAVSMVACSASKKGPPASGSFNLRIGQDQEIGSLDPQLKESGALRALMNGNVFEGLVAFSGGTSSEPAPVLATSWKQINPTTWRFNLAKGVKYQDGELFNADAVVYSVTRFLDPHRGSELTGYVDTLKKAVAVDQNTVDIVTKTPDSQLIRRLTWIMMVPPKASADLGTKPVGTGPFKFVSRTPNDIRLAAWDGYRGGVPKVATVLYETITDPGALVAGLQSGKYDIITDLPTDSTKLAPTVHSAPGYDVAALRLNTQGGITAKLSVRQAIASAIDIESLRDGLWGKYATPTNGNLVPKSVVGYNATLADPQYDLAKAKSLVKAAGAVGKTLRLIVPSDRYPKFEDTAQAIASDLGKAGFKVDVQILPYAQWLSAMLSHQKNAPELALTGVGSEDYHSALQPFQTYLASGAVAGMPPTAAYPQLASDINAVQATPDPTKQRTLLLSIAKLSQQSVSMIPLYGFDVVYGAAKGINWNVRGDEKIELSTVTR